MDDKGTFLLPEAASEIAKHVDPLYYFLHYMSVFFFTLVVVLMAVFVWRYRRRSEHDTTPRITHNTWLEVIWTAIPVVIIVILFFWGFSAFIHMRKAPHNSMVIHVSGKRWQWVFEYPNGTVSFSDLVVPVGKPVKLIMNSEDVIHSFFVPDFRVKQDVLPNRYTTLWFPTPEKPGEHTLFCTEYCGQSHSDMIGKVKVMEQKEFENWLATGGLDFESLPLPEIGKSLFKSRQCYTCHSIDGKPNVGPTLKGVFGHEVKLTKGGPAVADENYLRRSIVDPMAEVVAGYQPVMPTYKGLLKDREINALVEYIKTLE